MKQTIILAALALISLCSVGMISACVGICDGIGDLSYNVNMNSGFSSFGDSANFAGNGIQLQDINQMGTNGLEAQSLSTLNGCTNFNENTWASFSKTNGPGTDPYMDISKGLTNTGTGTAYSTMQYQDKNNHWVNGKFVDGTVELMSGLQTDSNINSAYLNSYFTNFGDMNSNANIDWNKMNVQATAGLTFDRYTDVLTVTPLQINANTVSFSAPSWYTTTFPSTTTSP